MTAKPLMTTALGLALVALSAGCSVSGSSSPEPTVATPRIVDTPARRGDVLDDIDCAVAIRTRLHGPAGQDPGLRPGAIPDGFDAVEAMWCAPEDSSIQSNEADLDAILNSSAPRRSTDPEVIQRLIDISRMPSSHKEPEPEVACDTPAPPIYTVYVAGSEGRGVVIGWPTGPAECVLDYTIDPAQELPELFPELP